TAELLRHLLLDDGGTRRQAQGDDGLAQQAVDLLGDRLAAIDLGRLRQGRGGRGARAPDNGGIALAGICTHRRASTRVGGANGAVARLSLTGATRILVYLPV